MTAALVILLVTAAIAVLWAVCTAAAGAFAGAVPTRVNFFTGPTLRLGQVRGVDVHLGVLPIGSSVRFLDLEQAPDTFDSPETAAEPKTWLGSREVFERLPLATRLSVLLIGWVPVFLFAQAVLGLRPAAVELVEGFRQIFRYLFDTAYASSAIAWLKTAIAQGRYLEAGATIGMKIVALNLLPLPVLTGGQILLEIVRSSSGRLLRWPDRLIGITFAIYLGALCVFVSRTWDAY